MLKSFISGKGMIVVICLQQSALDFGIIEIVFRVMMVFKAPSIIKIQNGIIFHLSLNFKIMLMAG